MQGTNRKIFCLMGPTASGKTDLAIKLVQKFPFEIISVDSAMVYCGLDIGSAKPTKEEQSLAYHHLIDIRDPSDPYSAAQFCQDALLKVEEIFAKGHIPLLVGGTMLYFRALQQGISNLPSADLQVREKILSELKEFGLEHLYLKLKKIDSDTANNISRTDSQRIQRALEVYEITGKTLTELKILNPPKPVPYDFVNMALLPPNMDLLRSKIKERFNKMIELGFVDEVIKLYRRGNLHLDLPAVRTVGYRQVWQYLSEDITYEKMLELVPIATNQLAKRQMTWLRSWKNINCFENNDKCMEASVMNSIEFWLR